MSYSPWNYFITIESDFAKTTRYVEITPHNYGTFSIEYAKILLASSSEIDVICKIFCRNIYPAQKCENINDYRNLIMKHYPRFCDNKIALDGYKIELLPWLDWKNNKNPPWWKSYNNVKHERNKYYHEANLENTIGSLAGLMSLLLYYYRVVENKFPVTFTKIFCSESLPVNIIAKGKKDLPDFG
jgi:hypothetical protein